MKNPYIGFKVKLISSQLGQVVGTVCSVTECKIELSNAVLNNKEGMYELIAVESQYVQDIRILATNNADEDLCHESSDATPPPHTAYEKGITTRRAKRRELLGSMPNSCVAYFCSDSPPLVHNTSTAQKFPDDRTEGSSAQANHGLLQKLDTARASLKATDKQANYRGKKCLPVERKRVMRQNFPMSEAVASSELSGTESDSMGLSTYPSAYRAIPGQLNGGSSSCRQPWSRSRAHLGSSRPGGSRQSSLQQQQQTAGNIRWDQVRVEDFIDQDFDFEKNLALFDKNAFYEKVDMKRQTGNPVAPQNSSGTMGTSVPRSSVKYDEGPDGVGVPLMGDIPHSVRAANRCQMSDYSDHCTLTTNTPTDSSSRKPHHYHLPTAARQPTGQQESDREKSERTDADQSVNWPVADTHLASLSNSHGVCATVPYLKDPVKSALQDWYSPAGQRIPLLTTEMRDRLLAYLATGLDPLEEYSLPRGKAVGLSWGRLLETSARSLTDHLMQLGRQTIQRPSQAPPIRVLIVPGGAHVSGSLSLTLARLLANRGACVLVLAPGQRNCHQWPADRTKIGVNAEQEEVVYRTELDLLLRMAPRLNLYGLEDDGMEEESGGCFVGGSGDDLLDDDEEQEDEAVVERQEEGGRVLDKVHTSGPGPSRVDVDEDELDALLGDSWLQENANEPQSVDSDMASGLTLCQTVGDAGGKPTTAAAPVDYSPVNRMWISRLPGLKLLRRISSLARLSTDVCVDLVIVAGQSEGEVRHHLTGWLRRHQAVSRLVYLMPTSGGIGDDVLLSRSGGTDCVTSVVELGLPTVSPSEVLTRSSPAITSRWLVDVGLTRTHVRRLTGDLKLLPPYGLFTNGSVVQLHWNRPLAGGAHA